MIQLYLLGKKIKEIMNLTGIKSEQTIYRLLDENNIPRRPKLESKRYLLLRIKKYCVYFKTKKIYLHILTML